MLGAAPVRCAQAKMKRLPKMVNNAVYTGSLQELDYLIDSVFGTDFAIWPELCAPGSEVHNLLLRCKDAQVELAKVVLPRGPH